MISSANELSASSPAASEFNEDIEASEDCGFRPLLATGGSVKSSTLLIGCNEGSASFTTASNDRNEGLLLSDFPWTAGRSNDALAEFSSSNVGYFPVRAALLAKYISALSTLLTLISEVNPVFRLETYRTELIFLTILSYERSLTSPALFLKVGLKA